MDIPAELIELVEAAAPALYEWSGVTGVGIGLREENGEFFDELAIRILVSDLAVADVLPATVADLPVCVIEFPVEPLFIADDARYDDLIGGIRAEQAPLANGTITALVLDADEEVVGLTCHHVAGDPGDPVWQPKALPAPFGFPVDITDTLGDVISCESPQTQSLPVPWGSLLLLGRPLDAATFSLDAATDELVGNRTLSPGVIDFGEVDATESPAMNMWVRKRGSQSGPTGGLVVGLHLIVDWKFGTAPPGHAYVMTHQWELFFDPTQCPDGVISRGGDSGALVIRRENQNAVGLLWGGTRDGGQRAMMSDITVVEERLGVTVAWTW